MPHHVPASVRRSVLTPLDRAVRARAVERRLVEAIELGLFAHGEQLPSEAALAAQLGVATVTLREALVELRRRGLVVTRRGRRGGSFVHAPAAHDDTRARERLAGYSVDELRDIADQRVAIATTSARLAADRASSVDLERLGSHVEAFDAAADDHARRRWDVRLHVELAAIARSRRLTTAEMDIHAEIGSFLWLTFSGTGADPARLEHRVIADAIRSGDADGAAKRMSDHIEREMRDLIALRLAGGGGAGTGVHARAGTHPEPPRAALDLVRAAVDEVFEALSSLRDEVLAIANPAHAAGHGLRRADLDLLRALLHRQLEQLPALAGLGMIFSPGTLVDAERWLEWLCRMPDGPPERLVTTLDPNAPDFYDYEAAEWYYEPRDRDERWIAGPFVDHSGTDAHIFTLSLPVVDAAGRFLGVASADLAVGTVEAIAEPALDGVAGEAILVSHRDRVIASNTTAWLPGTLYVREPTDTVLRDDGLTWALVLRDPEASGDGDSPVAPAPAALPRR